MISDADADADLLDVLNLARTPHGTVDNVMRVHSLRPNTMRGHVALYRAALHDAANTLPEWLQETISSYVSILNDCAYSLANHWANARHLIGNDAFQEADTTGITRPCTKHNYLVKNIADLEQTLHEAFYVARSGRPGPVVVDLPKDILIAETVYKGDLVDMTTHKTYRPQIKGDAKLVREAVAAIAGATRPLFYCGGGVLNSQGSG